MDCDEVRVQISALMDDNQEVQVQVKDIHDHLGSCSSCSEFYEEKLKVTEWLKEAENFQLEPPPGIWERIDSEITPKPKTSGKKPTPPAKK
jgi:predicted anti-sigma-YlaC factor YlaD